MAKSCRNSFLIFFLAPTFFLTPSSLRHKSLSEDGLLSNMWLNVFPIRIARIASSEKSQFLWELFSWQAASDRAPDWSKGGQKKHRSEILFQKKTPRASLLTVFTIIAEFCDLFRRHGRYLNQAHWHQKGLRFKPRETGVGEWKETVKTQNTVVTDIVSFPMSKRKDKFGAWSFNLFL